MKDIARPVNPAKALFLISTLVLGGCASRPTKYFTPSKVQGSYWKFIEKFDKYDYFDATGKLKGIVSEFNGTFEAQAGCGFNGTQVGLYDTVEHAQRAIEIYRPIEEPAQLNHQAYLFGRPIDNIASDSTVRMELGANTLRIKSVAK